MSILTVHQVAQRLIQTIQEIDLLCMVWDVEFRAIQPPYFGA